MSSMAALTTATTGTTITSAAYNANLNTLQNFINGKTVKNDEAGTVTSTSAPQWTVAYDGSNTATFSVSSGGVLTVSATSTITVSKATTFSSTVTVGNTLTMGSGVGINGSGGLIIGTTDASSVTIKANGTNAWSVTSAGNLFAVTDATVDIGASGANRPRDLFLARNAAVGGTLAVTGAATLSSTLAVTGAATLTGAVAMNGGASISGNFDVSGGSVRGQVATDLTLTTISSVNKVVIGRLLSCVAASTSAASINIAAGTAPTSPNDGDFWYDAGGLKFRAGGTTRTITWT